MAERLDQQLVRLGLVRSRTQARALIDAGQVMAGSGATRRTLTRAAMPAIANDAVALTVDAFGEPVSRGALKLAAVLERSADAGDPARRIRPHPIVHDALCLDAGQSTGGFTECLLGHGARLVVGVEVGHGQLAPALREDRRVVCLEHTHIGDCTLPMLAANPGIAGRARLAARLAGGTGFDCVVADLSFISLRLVLATLAGLLRDDGHCFALVKPQFELGRGALNRRGIVTDAAAKAGLHLTFRQACASAGLALLDWMDSPIQGGDGNTEFLMHTRKINRRT